jgi:glutathione S-transferase
MLARPMASPTLYVLPGSHPCATVEAALELKGIDYRRVNLLPIVSVLLGRLRWGGTTVPGMRIDGQRIVGSRAILRRLDELAPAPPLLPPDGTTERAEVLEAEQWGDEVFQSVPRRILDVGFLRNPTAIESYAGDAKLPLPRPLLRPALPATARLMAIKNKATDDVAAKDIAELPARLDTIDDWISKGVLGGDQPNAADLQIGSTVRLLQTVADLLPLLEGHAATTLTRYFPPMSGEIPAGTLPAEWIAAARSGDAAPA